MEAQTVTPRHQNDPDSKRSDLWKLQGIFFEPSATFEAIRERPSWWLPILLSVAVSILAAAAIYQLVDLRDLMESQFRSSPSAAQMSSEQIQERIDEIVDSPFWPLLKWAGPLISPLVLVIAVSGLIMVLVHVTGSEASFKRLLAVTSHSCFFYYLVVSLLTVLVFYMSSDPQEIELENAVYSHLGPLVDAEESPLLHRFASGVDVINLYVVYLLGLGVSIVGRKVSLAKGLILVGSLYGLYVVAGIAWKALLA